MVLSRDRARWGCSPTCPTRPIPQRVPQQTPTNRVLVGTTSPNAFGTCWEKHQPLTMFERAPTPPRTSALGADKKKRSAAVCAATPITNGHLRGWERAAGDEDQPRLSGWRRRRADSTWMTSHVKLLGLQLQWSRALNFCHVDHAEHSIKATGKYNCSKGAGDCDDHMGFFGRG